MALSRTDEDYMAGLDRQQIQQLENNFMKFTKNPDELQLILIAGECGTTVEEAKVRFSFTSFNNNIITYLLQFM